jgi:hypothetical protein
LPTCGARSSSTATLIERLPLIQIAHLNARVLMSRERENMKNQARWTICASRKFKAGAAQRPKYSRHIQPWVGNCGKPVKLKDIRRGKAGFAYGPRQTQPGRRGDQSGRTSAGINPGLRFA